MTQEEFEARIPRYCFCISITDNEKKIDKEVAYNTNSLDVIPSELEKMLRELKQEQ